MSAEKISPLAPDAFPRLAAVSGVGLATLAAGLRYQGRSDLMLAAFPEGAAVAGVFTRSRCASAPVDWCRRCLPRGRARALVCNAGNANAFTGSEGDEAARLTAERIGARLGIDARDVYLASTGVIGEPMPTDLLVPALDSVAGRLTPCAETQWREVADAIRTTDTFAKGAGRTVTIGEREVNLAGIAKGSGMIAPDMATMLAFLFTDASLPPGVLQRLLQDAVSRSFNRISVDSDTSTSDTVLLFATGAAVRPELPPDADTPDDPRLGDFREALEDVCRSLAHQIVRDGEGATKFVTVRVKGAEDDAAATRIAFAIGNSPLVKTMLAAEDANWGRLVMAVGKAGERADRDRLRIWIGGEQCAEGGRMRAGYSEERATAFLKRPEVLLEVDVAIGEGTGTIWTCDLTHGYIDINAGYRS